MSYVLDDDGMRREMYTFSAFPLGPGGRTRRLLYDSRGTERGGPADGVVFFGLFDLVVDRLLVVHSRGRGGGGGRRCSATVRAKVHVIQVVEVGRGRGTVGRLVTVVGVGRLDDGPASGYRACAAGQYGRGRARRHGEVAAGGRGTGRRTVADGRRVTGDVAVRICGEKKTIDVRATIKKKIYVIFSNECGRGVLGLGLAVVSRASKCVFSRVYVLLLLFFYSQFEQTKKKKSVDFTG